jgi:hypothetical protein
MALHNASIKNHTEKSRDGVRTGLGERAVKRRPACSKGVHTSSVTVCVCFFSTLFGRCAQAVRPWPRAKYFPVLPSYSVNKYILYVHVWNFYTCSTLTFCKLFDILFLLLSLSCPCHHHVCTWAIHTLYDPCVFVSLLDYSCSSNSCAHICHIYPIYPTYPI